MAEIVIEVFAKNPPSILFVLGFLLLVLGFTTQDGRVVEAGWILVIFGVVLQVLWLFIFGRR
ncbi:hypothetical protein MUP77_00075 [Candidatus Bathyarchaeota archaeon]|nr:hypothetical protein [Candidatus Bathyarchaeota archaeon]